MKLGVYLINLDSSTERLAQASAELKKHNIEFERISAVDGRKLDVKTYAGYNSIRSNAYTGRDLIGAEIGCYLSHKKALETFAQSENEFALILEDDLSLVNNFNDVLNKTMNYLHDHAVNWAVINVAANKKKLAKPITEISDHELLHAYYFPILALGLLWTKEGAKSFLSKMNEIYTPIDVEIQSWACKTGLGLSIYPAIVRPSGVESDIDANTIALKKDSLRVDRFIPKQKRLWQNKINAMKYLYFKTH
ncbi:glycosyltransferase family 25 protein [Acinetobacter faecalis]|uniref:glycosyltransferase family 25 protein n=1 Tax=Acinetobacter faecalis TaxID=2665161 RepID=UPI002A91710C|nr:glycosyltransferase family 25 protein [Acinetobacter faecalis]MDY6459038.1 glycosyltransferase family 25 protein [Acinetobacter faecalis]MDY6483639.1 glycosyltransferase family 25 protein [Acinetobacter faecalis]MDY6536259.1 glycosyltransferase family 25 protein [Acinetobacter faecalis]